MAPRRTQRDIAERLGLHVTTVSKALRGDERIARATRERIRREAENIGYVPDPALSSLIAYRQRKSTAYRASIGWIFNHDRQTDMSIFPGYADILRGARERARRLGYAVDEFWLHEDGLSEKRLAGILETRHIAGVVIAPQMRRGTPLHLPWHRLAAVSIGHTLLEPELPVVATDHFRAMTSLLDTLRKRDYRRIGLALWREDNERMDRRAQSAFLAYSEGLDVTVALYEQLERERFMDWVKKHELDAVVVRDATPLDWLTQAGYRVPEQIGVAAYTLPGEHARLSGIYHNHARVGELAVDRLAQMLQFGERGLPACPDRLLVSASWREGGTVRLSPAMTHPYDNKGRFTEELG
jgi:DNA-binding LacI/PurR family transcriptional regulator